MSYQIQKQFLKVQKPMIHAKKKWRGFKVVLFLCVTIFMGVSIFLWQTWQPPLTAPISSTTTFSFLPYDSVMGSITQPKLIYGFLPYWNLEKTTLNDSLTHVAYFALTIGGDGTLRTQGDEESLTGYRKLQSESFLDIIEKTQKDSIQLELVLKQFSPQETTAFLLSKRAQTKFYDQLDSVMLAYPFRGINLDIELSDGQQLQTKLTEFVTDLNRHLDSVAPNTTVSIDVYPSAAQGGNIWNLSELAPHVDYVIVMAYDFHRRQSAQAGPVSPLLGGDVYQNINQHLKEILELVPAEKILLGVPFYGYEWQTTSRDEQALTYPDSGSTASYQRVLDILAQKEELKVQERWNEIALSPYLSYEKSGQTFVIYYENSRSLSYKLDYVNQLNLAGIAVWALGYEGDANELWSVINDKLALP